MVFKEETEQKKLQNFIRKEVGDKRRGKYQVKRIERKLARLKTKWQTLFHCMPCA